MAEYEMAAFGASEAACVYYPAEDQQKERDAYCRGAAEALTAWNARTVQAELVEALEPSGDTKAAYMGEFSFNLRRVDECGDEYSEKVYVPWDTIKEIMAAIRARATLTARAGG